MKRLLEMFQFQKNEKSPKYRKNTKTANKWKRFSLLKCLKTSDLDLQTFESFSKIFAKIFRSFACMLTSFPKVFESFKFFSTGDFTCWGHMVTWRANLGHIWDSSEQIELHFGFVVHPRVTVIIWWSRNLPFRDHKHLYSNTLVLLPSNVANIEAGKTRQQCNVACNV